MEGALDSWIRIRKEMDRLSTRKKELGDTLKTVEERILAKHILDDQPVKYEGYTFKAKQREVAERRVPKKEKILLMAASLEEQFLSAADSDYTPDCDEAIKTILESALPEKVTVRRLIVKKVKPKK